MPTLLDRLDDAIDESAPPTHLVYRVGDAWAHQDGPFATTDGGMSALRLHEADLLAGVHDGCHVDCIALVRGDSPADAEAAARGGDFLASAHRHEVDETVDVSPLAPHKGNLVAAFRTDEPGFTMVNSKHLVVTKDEDKDPKYVAGLKAHPVTTAAKFMSKAIAGEVPHRSPLIVRKNGDGTHTVLDGSATTLAIKATSPEGEMVPAYVVEAQVNEVVKGVHDFLDGHHQVTYLGKHGDFHLYSAVHLHTEGQTPDASPEMMAHHKKVHTLDDYRSARFNYGKSPEDQVDAKPTDKHFVSDKLLALGSATHSVAPDAAERATRVLRQAGLPSQTRHVVFIDQSQQKNQNTGDLGVGGHWDKHKHVIAVNRAQINGRGNDGATVTSTLTHEWAHAFHDEMSKPQKAAWKDFYHKHVVQPTSPAGTEEDRQKYIEKFADAYMSHPNTKAFDDNLKARKNAEVPRAGMHQSSKRSNPDWWKGMLDDGHLGEHAAAGWGKGVVAQTSHTLHGYSDPDDKSTRKAIRKNAYVHVRAVAENDPTDRAHMNRNLFEPHEAKHLLAVSPVGKPDHVAIVDTRNLKYHPAIGPSKVGTHLLYDHDKTREMYHAGAQAHSAKRAADPMATEVDRNFHRAAAKAPLSNTPDHLHTMSQRFKDEVELSGSDHKTVSGYVNYVKSRGYNNLGVAVADAHSIAHKAFPKVHLPAGEHTALDHVSRVILDGVANGNDHRSVAANAIRYNVTTGHSPTNFIGAGRNDDREKAAGEFRAFSSYGASNDKELFATTAEHMAVQHPFGANQLHPQHRKLVKAWHGVINGATKVAERIACALGEQSVHEAGGNDPDDFDVFSVPAGGRLYHGAHAARATEIAASGVLHGRPAHKTSGGLNTEGGMVWFGHDAERAQHWATGRMDPIASSRDAGRTPGKVFVHTTDRPLRFIHRNHEMSAEQAATVNDHFNLPDYKKVRAGERLSTAVESRAGSLTRVRDSVPSYTTPSGGTTHEMWPGVLKRLGYDGFHDSSGVALAVGAAHVPVTPL